MAGSKDTTADNRTTRNLTDEPSSKNSIENAIAECKEKVVKHRRQSGYILLFVVSFLGFIIFSLLMSSTGIGKFSDKVDQIASMDSSWAYIGAGFVIMVFGVFMSIYRFHLKEAAKYEHLHIGFLRIRVAGNNTKAGYQSEVRKSLTENAFQFEAGQTLFNANKKVNNPLPGHPTSDISTLIVNKLLENVDFQKKTQSSQSK